MPNKYTRHQTAISRNADNGIEEDYWLNKFKQSLEKGAVQSKSVDSFLFDQINSIMHNKSKYPSVAAAVKDMQDRSGFTDHLGKVSEDENDVVTKVAFDENDTIDKKIPIEEILPTVIKKCPAIQGTLGNIIRDSRGNSSIPAIIDKLRSIHSVDISNGKDWDDEALIIFVSKVNLEEKKNNPLVDDFSHLGIRDNSEEADQSNTDAFHALMPAKF